MVSTEDMQLWYRICVHIKPSAVYRLLDHKYFNLLRERFDKFKILKIWDEKVIISNFFKKNQFDMENRLRRLYWTLKCIGIGYGS